MKKPLDNQVLVPHLAIVGFKNSGKTTLMCKLIQGLSNRGLRVGTIKHDGHDFEIDYPDTDTYQFQKAGATSVVIQSAYKIAMIEHVQKEQKPYNVYDLIRKFRDVDVVLVEGYKFVALPKIVVALQESQLRGLDQLESIQAYCVDPSLQSKVNAGSSDIPILSLNDEVCILNFVLRFLRQKQETPEW